MTRKRPTSVAVIGQGLIGGALSDRLVADGLQVLRVARRPAAGSVQVDLTTPDGRTNLSQLLLRWRPGAVVLVHGPMDIDWCGAHEHEAVAAHGDTAALVARMGVPVVLASSDAVFSGEERAYPDSAPPSPAAAYGRAKLAAERALAERDDATIVRLSYVYGRLREPPDPVPRFDVACLQSLSAGRPFAAPSDQYFTPVFIDDVTAVLAAAVLRGVSAAALFHLAGSRRLSRFEFALEVARRVGAASGPVVPAPRSETRWASRPASSCLISSDLSPLFGGTPFRLTDLRDGIARFVAESGIQAAARLT